MRLDLQRLSLPSSPIHRLHPLVKIYVGLSFSLLALALKEPLALGILLAFILLVLVAARLRFGWRRWCGILAFMALFSCLNVLASDTPRSAATYSLRLLVFMLAVPMFAATTAPQEIARSLSRLSLPPGVIVAMLLVWRFFPVLAQESRHIVEAGQLWKTSGSGRLRRWYRGFVIPLTFTIFEYADRLPLALELRGFHPGRPRTPYRIPRAGCSDIAFIAASQTALLLAAGCQWGGRFS
jgi:energy-coupling factor transport system permease protein